MGKKHERKNWRGLTVRIHTVPSPDADERFCRAIDVLLKAAARGTTKSEDSIKGKKPAEDGLAGGKEYEIDKKRIRPPRAPVKLSPEARAKLTDRLRQSRDFTSQNAKLQAKSEAKKQSKGKTINQQLRTMK